MFIAYSLRHVALLSAVLIFSIPAMAESSWFWQHPYPTGSNVNGIQFIDNDNGWIVTELGALFGTGDGGITWEELYRGGASLGRVFFLDISEGWACGNNGILLHTINGGDNWTSSHPSSNNLYSIEFIDENYGTVVGKNGTILRTMNGGESWQIQGSGISVQIHDVSFVSPTLGWTTATTGNVLKTETAGAFWQEQSTGIPVGYTGIHFIDDLYGFAVGEECVVFTGNGGDSWSVAYEKSGDWFSDVDMTGNLGAASGLLGVAVTENEGGNWEYEGMPEHPLWSFEPHLNCITVPTDSRVITSGDYGIIYSRDSAGDWGQLSSHETLADLNGITHFDNYRIWACGESGVIMKSTDGGVNWESQIIDDDYSLQDIHFQTTLLGFCVGSSTSGGVILKTVNGGSSWTNITPASIVEDGLQSIDFYNESCGIAVGLNGGIVYTSNGGANWTEKNGFGEDDLFRIRFGDTDRGWIVGDGGKIICFDFSSDSWSEQSSDTTYPLDGLFALNADTAWAVGGSGTILRTLDTGNFWETVAFTGRSYKDVWFDSNGLDGYFTGYGGSGKFGITDDGGFTVIHPGWGNSLRNQLSEISFIDVNNGWGCGNYGRILRFGEDPTGIEDFHHPVSLTPGVGILTSPNPFTASSTVFFTLPVECHVGLDLYDLAGRKVQTLQSGILSGGEHNLMVTGDDLAPGLYFLRLTAGDLSETRAIVRIP